MELDADVLLQDELNHPSLCLINERFRRSSDIPIVSIVHHLTCLAERRPSRAARHRVLEQRYLRSVDGFVFNSWATRGSVRSLVPDADGAVAHPGKEHVAPDVSSRRDLDGQLRVLYLGNILPHKGLDVLLRAIASLPRSSACLDVVGAPLDPAYLLAVGNVVASGGLGDVVRFHGRLSNAERDKVMRSCDVLVLPSYHEGYGLVIVEAMASGLPVIAPASGGAREIVSHGREGYLVGGGDTEGIANGLRSLFDPALKATMSERARRRFDRLPSWRTEMERARAYLLGMANESLNIISHES
jgi:glycosyltransferase involved in cell wall biosynthesis